MTWIAFLFVSAVIVYAGTQLARYGDMIADRSGMGRTWIGAVLVAATTSLPELATGVSSTAVYRATDIAVGDVLGSCLFNLLLLSVMDGLGGDQPISSRAAPGHALSIAFGSMLIGLAGLSLLAEPNLPHLRWIGWYTPLMIGIYLLSMRSLFHYERRQRERMPAVLEEEAVPHAISTGVVWFRYSIHALVVVVAATLLPGLGQQIASETGLEQSFVGSMFIAASTSMPELVVCISALRLGAVDLAIGNVLGSNIFNMFILALDDIFYLPGPILATVSRSHLIAILAALIMNSLVLAGLTYQSMRKRLALAADTWGIVAIYVAAMVLLARQHS
ncbi:MAG: hypothetical protein R2762_28280 [Bryobacteraceae bacterium]